jgi:hypothetical protein
MIVMNITDGNVQIRSVKYARLVPPILYPTATRVWVELGPGSI